MASIRPPLILAAALLGLAGAGLWTWRILHPRPAPRVVLLTPEIAGLDPQAAQGAGRLWMDQLEVASGATVLAPTTPPSETQLRSLPGTDLVMRLSGRRVGDALGLRLAWIRASDLADGRPWGIVEIPPEGPKEAFQALQRGLPLPRARASVRLLPEDAQRFWRLAAQVAVTDDAAALQDLDSARALAEAEPASAAAWLNCGEHLYRSLWAEPAGGSLPQGQALEAFDRALALLPGYPRAALLKGMLLTDVGDQRSALQELSAARKLRPGVPDLYAGLAYAGRTSGLLEGAGRAVAIRRRLTAPLDLPSPWFAENTFLYQGDTAAFRASLRARRDPVFLFYTGYLDLAEGHAAEALAAFQAGAALRGTSMPFSDLCAVYALAVEGKRVEALKALTAFEEARGRLRVPDGELTFKVAEAYAYLGQAEKADEAAGRAFAQGFGCLAWYDRSPFFAPARQSPRWTALRQHLQERQELLARSFPLSTFG
ncbi:MAG TPA: hypothetical protein VFT46_09855 [Holophagaceae bacterium]|nr:hypothetical protein [Holophagaceae bacterium]